MADMSTGDWVSAIGQGTQSASGIAGTITALLGIGKESESSRRARHSWEATKKPAADLLSQLYYNPLQEKTYVPYGQGSAYKYAPSQSMQAMYSNYLNRQYGLSNDVAQSMVSQSLNPVKLAKLKGYMNSAMANRGSQADASAIANAGLGVQTPNILRSQDYLQNAGKLAGFNLWRAQQLGQIIG